MTSSFPRVGISSQPGLVNGEEIITEAILSRPVFKDRGYCSFKVPCLCDYIRSRLYLTRSSIVFYAGNKTRYFDFSIDLSNIECIKSLSVVEYKGIFLRYEVRPYSQLIIQLKEESSEKMYMTGFIQMFSCIKFDVDSFSYECLNGDDFVQAVKQQMRALNRQ